ncbi:porin [Oxalobacteraceae bacterium]|nr:porin [Oxalobacteraceae bacterium]
MNKLLLTAAICAAFGSAHAELVNDGNLSISGFGTLGVAKADLAQGQFVRYNQASGASDSPRIDLDSNLGLQASYKINDSLSGTVQILTRKNTSPEFTTDLTWAFLKYRINDEFSVRVGRMVQPTFMISDYQNVGYANTMMRPPVEMYSQAPIEAADGADLTYQHAFGDTNFSAQGYAGTSRGKLFTSTTLSVGTYRNPVMGLTLTAEHGPLTLRLAHNRVEINSNSVPIDQLLDRVSTLGYPGLAADLTLKSHKHIAFTSLGLALDWNNIVAQAEYAQRRSRDKSFLADVNTWYAMAGYRFGKILPYYAHAANHDVGHSISLPPAFLATPLAGAISGLIKATEQKTDLIGVRWDFAKNVALKVQVDRVSPITKSGMLAYTPANYTQKVTVVAASLDFVF